MNRSSPFNQAMSKAAAEILQGYLQQSGGNVTEAAKIAGLNRGWFYQLCERHHVISPVPPPSPRKAASIFSTWVTAHKGS